jgi:hypothetical protein
MAAGEAWTRWPIHEDVIARPVSAHRIGYVERRVTLSDKEVRENAHRAAVRRG